MSTYVWRLELECGHTRLEGPWDGTHVAPWCVNDIAYCEVCPMVADPSGRPTLRLRRVVDVDTVSQLACREPTTELLAEYDAQNAAERDATGWK